MERKNEMKTLFKRRKRLDTKRSREKRKKNN